MYFRSAVHRTAYPRRRSSSSNSFRVRARRMHWSMTYISRSFQLSPLAADRYSLADIPWGCVSLGLTTGYPWTRQSSSLSSRRFRKPAGVICSLRPSCQLTELITKWEWGLSVSQWVQTSTSCPGHARSANSRARSWASAEEMVDRESKDWVNW